ncbi:hypothetical protein HAX54_028231 [Datura stramonium]|uniref:Uncharacterized protein n=1 Tax=Datura stramonium TaxID=4076 RepID=A0ABS8S9F1_DATST|nr:hypothetical protein [Datura stramonium]
MDKRCASSSAIRSKAPVVHSAGRGTTRSGSQDGPRGPRHRQILSLKAPEWGVSFELLLEKCENKLFGTLHQRATFSMERHDSCDPGKIISYVKECKMINHGCLGFITTVHDTRAEDVTIDSVPIAREFIDVFQKVPQLPK